MKVRGGSDRRRRQWLGRRRRPAGRAARRHLRRLPGQQRVEGRDREVARQAGRQARAAARAAGHGLAGRVRREEPQLRRRRLGRLLPDARRDLEPRATADSRSTPSCRPSGSSTRPSPSRRRRSPPVTPTSARTPRSGASGSPTSSAPPSSTAAATSCGSGKPAGCSRVNRRTARPKPGRSSQLG